MKLLAVVLIGLLIPAVLCRQWDQPTADWLRTQRGFNPDLERARVSAAQPEWVLIGNSMLGTRIDEQALSELSGIKACKVYRAGSQSAVWFLIFKQVILASEAKPRVVTFFFRETDLTWPQFRTDGLQLGGILAMNGHEQPEWQQVLKPDSSLVDRTLDLTSRTLKELLPSYHLAQTAHDYVQSRPMRITLIGTSMSVDERRAELNERFSLSHLRHDLGSDAAPSAVDDDGITGDFYRNGPQTFDPSPTASFLPHMVQLAKSRGVKLHFHRIKQRPRTAGDRQDLPERVQYMSDLRTWLEQQGCALTDETQDATLTLNMYADGDHIKEDPEVAAKYHTSFWNRVRSVVSER
jgi:hypothetical protein